MQDIVIFIEPNEDAFIKSEKIANFYMNRFLIDEDARNELLEIIELGKSPFIPYETRDPIQKFDQENIKGMNKSIALPCYRTQA